MSHHYEFAKIEKLITKKKLCFAARSTFKIYFFPSFRINLATGACFSSKLYLILSIFHHFSRNLNRPLVFFPRSMYTLNKINEA
jgi:hypothetical protein